jgi:hypothetical protein
VRCAPVGAGGKTDRVFTARAVEVNPSGVQIVGSQDSGWEEGVIAGATQLFMSLELPGVVPIRALGELRWVRPLDDDSGRCLLGILFVGFPSGEAQRLARALLAPAGEERTELPSTKLSRPSSWRRFTDRRTRSA